MKVTKSSQHVHQPHNNPCLPHNEPSKGTPKPVVSPTTKPLTQGKENFDSKTSTQDRTHKLDLSHLPLKDISNIEAESIEYQESSPENNLSGLSIIDMLDKEVPKPKEVVNTGSVSDTTAIRRDLEMKNRLIETLMNENASLRQEMEVILNKVEKAKGKLNSGLQDSNHKIFELEKQVEVLEAENRSLKEQIKKKVSGEIIAKKLDHQVEHYCSATKADMEKFHAWLNQQMASYEEVSKQQHESFIKSIQACVRDSKSENGMMEAIPEAESLIINGKLEISGDKEEVTGKRLPKAGFMTQSLPSLMTVRGEGGKKAVGTMNKGITGGQSSRNYLNSSEKIDEKAELPVAKRRSVFVKTQTDEQLGVKRRETIESTQVAKKNNNSGRGVKDIQTGKQIGNNRGSVGMGVSQKKKV